MKKNSLGVLAFLLSAAFLSACVSGGANGGSSDSVSTQTSSSAEASSSVESGVADHKDIVAYFKNATGMAELTAEMDMEINTNVSGFDILFGGEATEQITIDGGNRHTLTIGGLGGGVIKAANDGLLVLKNLTIESKPYLLQNGAHRKGYADFGGRVRFENCTFDAGIQLRDDVRAEFVNCKIASPSSDYYAIWFSDGQASFEGCTFTGSRGIKLYEGSDITKEWRADYDVENLTLENCVFSKLSKKPGLAIDVFTAQPTVVTIKDCEFNECQPWTKDSFEGMDGVYESDVDTTELTFTMEGVLVNGIPYEYYERETSN